MPFIENLTAASLRASHHLPADEALPLKPFACLGEPTRGSRYSSKLIWQWKVELAVILIEPCLEEP